jgi:hypothetical protein
MSRRTALAAAEQLDLFAQAAPAMTIGARIRVPARADIARRHGYELTLTREPSRTRNGDGLVLLHVRGELPRLRPGRKREVIAAMLRAELVEVVEAAPEPIRAVPAPVRDPNQILGLLLSGPGGWSVTDAECPNCGTRFTVVAQLAADAVEPRWECRSCRHDGRMVEVDK